MREDAMPADWPGGTRCSSCSGLMKPASLIRQVWYEVRTDHRKIMKASANGL